MRIQTLIVLLLCCFIGETFAADTPDSFTIYLVRHAEKQADGSRDPELTEPWCETFPEIGGLVCWQEHRKHLVQ